jgi:L-seryl-tRNA(Ser) seleniumtransferase
MNSKQRLLSQIPPVNEILNHRKIQPLLKKYSRHLIHSIIREEIDSHKNALLKNKSDSSRQANTHQIVKSVIDKIVDLMQPNLRRVINATGVILHTGLGRAPLAEEARENLIRISEGYCCLEIDLQSGERGDRASHIEQLVCRLTGAEAACVVNNNAAAVLLTLNTLAFEREVLISRGQLIEIGGSFRMPDVMQKSGAKMIEVGTTNKTHTKDFEEAITAATGLICVVHPSNYRVRGFTKEVGLEEIVALATKHRVPVFQDLGGGVLIDLRKYKLPYEPVVRESVEMGVDAITFSGDKVLGGPQSGLIVGKRRYIDAIKQNPLLRALRCDKLVYAALEPTLRSYFSEGSLRATNEVMRMLTEPNRSVKNRAKEILKRVSTTAKAQCEIRIEPTKAQMGSGALPLEELASWALVLKSDRITTEGLARKFRLHSNPVIGYIRDDALYFDIRTIQRSEEESLIAAMQHVLLNLA